MAIVIRNLILVNVRRPFFWDPQGGSHRSCGSQKWPKCARSDPKVARSDL